MIKARNHSKKVKVKINYLQKISALLLIREKVGSSRWVTLLEINKNK